MLIFFSSSSALQLFMSFGLLNYFFPFLPFLRRLFPIIHSHLPQVIPHVVLPSYSWPSLWSCWIRFPFVYGLGHTFVGHSSICPNQPSRLYFIYLTIFSLLIASCNSSFVLSLHSPFAFCVGPCASSGGQIVLYSIWYHYTLYVAVRCTVLSQPVHRTAIYIV